MLYYLPIESYKERYTEQLRIWTNKRIQKREIPYITFDGEPLTRTIKAGVVLDAYGRTHYSLTQIAKLVSYLQTNGGFKQSDIVYVQDMFTPGIEALFYIASQTEMPRFYFRCWAQSWDIYDFTQSMRHWMRRYERMCMSVPGGIFVASAELRNLIKMAEVDVDIPVYNVGLPFDIQEVRERAGTLPDTKDKRILFVSRWDMEKNPLFYTELQYAATLDRFFDDYEFAVSTSSPELRSNNSMLLDVLYKSGIEIYENLTKDAYYRLLAGSTVHFNCAYQDWVSFTMLEAGALGTVSIVPAFRSFPEAVDKDYRYLYKPFDVNDALATIKQAIETDLQPCEYAYTYNDGTLDRELDVMFGSNR